MNTQLKLAGLTALLVAAAGVSAQAADEPQLGKINQYLTVDGYVGVSGTITDVKHGPTDYSLFDSSQANFDAAKFGIKAQSANGEFSAYVSALYVPEFGYHEAGILDAYVEWKRSGFTVTAGKFLSNLGYESFYIPQLDQLTYSAVQGIPAYHSGIRFAYATSRIEVGVSVLDSLQPQDHGFYSGDADLNNVGLEAYAQYKAEETSELAGLTLFAGLGYDSGNDYFKADSQLTFDFWAEYEWQKLTFAAEIAYAEDVADLSWRVSAKYKHNEQFSGIVRISGAKEANDGDKFYQFTIAPAYRYNENLSLRLEFSYQKTEGSSQDAFFFGAQTVFQF
jgi:hypothetical protein